MRIGLLASLAAALAGCGSPDSPGSSESSGKEGPAPPPAIAFDGALGGGAVAHGERLTRVLGCTGCHSGDLQGKPFYELYAANLTRDVAEYDDAQLERLLREGRRIDGRDLWSMPSDIFQHLSKPDMAALIAYLRTLRPAGRPTRPFTGLSAKIRAEVAAGKTKPAAQWVAETRGKAPVDLGPRHALGRYITRVTCAECHNARLEGYEGDTPDLIVAGTYTRAEFETLIRKGIPNGPRKLDLMAEVARNRFAKLTPREADAVYAYLKARSEQPQ
jgi:mono/diheme cytochrome c family protein